LQIQKLELKQPWNPEKPKLDETDLDGSLTLKGTSNPIKGTVQVSDKGEVQAEFKIKLSDFKVDIPRYMGITVADEVKIKIHLSDLKAATGQVQASR
jgi:polyisoprenoid-binding protein YceI